MIQAQLGSNHLGSNQPSAPFDHNTHLAGVNGRRTGLSSSGRRIRTQRSSLVADSLRPDSNRTHCLNCGQPRAGTSGGSTLRPSAC